MFHGMFRSPIRLGLLNLHDYEEDCTPSQERLPLQRGSANFLRLDTTIAFTSSVGAGNLNRSPVAGANIGSIFMTQPNGIIKF